MLNNSNRYTPSNEIEKLFINNVWRLDAYYPESITETILPKGTIEIIFNLSENIRYINSKTDSNFTLPKCFINGVNFHPFNLIKLGQQTFIGIQLNTLGLKGLFNINVKEFNNNVVEGSLVCKSLHRLSQKLSLNNTFESQVSFIRQWLWELISLSKFQQHIYNMQSIFYKSNADELSIYKLCKHINVSDRQLRRISGEWLGMNTETFLRYKKYLSSLFFLHSSTMTLTQIGLEAGYYDQSHFIREFISFTSFSPKKYLSASPIYPGHILS